MIKRYLKFISENKMGFNTIGEWIESLSDDDYVMNIVNRYIKEISPDINLANAINLLDDRDQHDIKSQVENYLSDGIVDKDPTILTSTRISNVMNHRSGLSNKFDVGVSGGKFVGESVDGEISVSGKGVFNSFLKSLTALGKKESSPNYEKCPETFLMFYCFDGIDGESIKLIFNRFKSLSRYSNMIDYQQNEVSLYFGIKCDGQFEYGVMYDSLLPMGQFKLSQSTIKWLVNLPLKSASSIKKEIVNLTYSDIITMGKIKNDMKEFNPGYYEKKNLPVVTDKVISFGYYGVGRWDNGKLDNTELLNIRNNFSNWVLAKSWGGKVLISIQPQSFWLNIHIKLK